MYFLALTKLYLDVSSLKRKKKKLMYLYSIMLSLMTHASYEDSDRCYPPPTLKKKYITH